MLREGMMLCERTILSKEMIYVYQYFNEHARELLVHSRVPDHCARLVIVKTNVVRLVCCSSISELSLLGSAAISAFCNVWPYSFLKAECRKLYGIKMMFRRHVISGI
jgi:hypothetical protein